MTYRELLQELEKMTEEQLDMDVTVYSVCDDEYYEGSLSYVVETDVLDEKHPVITFNSEIPDENSL